MNAETFTGDLKFMTPAFQIVLNGQRTDPLVLRDVLEVSFTSDLENVDSFEFVLNDWDPVARLPKYSSPWGPTGAPLQLAPGGPDVPNFEPGAEVELHLGYLEQGALPLIMVGEVVSLAPGFPASGAPTCRVRALNRFFRGMQKVYVTGNYDGTDKAIIEALCRDHDVPLSMAAPAAEGELRERVEVDGYLQDEIAKRAKGYGLSMATAPGEDGRDMLILFDAARAQGDPVAEFLWGRTLVSFSPALSAAAQYSAVEARAQDPRQSGDAQNVAVTRRWSDIGLAADALGPAGQADLSTAVGGMVKVIKPADARTEEDAAKAAETALREMAQTLITGSGTSVGLPGLRAGMRVTMGGMGARFDGTWQVTQATHALGGAGYTTSFQARKEVLEGGAGLG
ncbi:phage late control D family protein [Mangrovicoccus algicola]|uniref:Phage late control D family protein n=1 Tax=Mangrovicoccus algicola TaxID=2771008 RepID=A0A8J7CZS7_9RHOB|nr:phage late control D family protein [Mangrovicoccus algicola]MBE3638368.1 phage late control D family protein [Mangrovicoccus algicola]